MCARGGRGVCTRVQECVLEGTGVCARAIPDALTKTPRALPAGLEAIPETVRTLLNKRDKLFEVFLEGQQPRVRKDLPER